MKLGKFVLILSLFYAVNLFADEIVVKNFSELIEAIDTGNDAVLLKSRVYEVTKPIYFKCDGQKIYTKDAKRISEYAILRMANPEFGQIINSNSQSDILVERVILDGNRYSLPPFTGKGQEMVWFGGKASGQTMRNCVLINTRTWSSFKMNEGSSNSVMENCIIFGSGVDTRGSGKHRDEKPFKWGDGITCAARNVKIKNNIIIDATDVGIVLFSAPGAHVSNNVISAVSRECLGGINLVDGLYCYEIDKVNTMLEGPLATRKYDYTVNVENNLIDAFGARIHMAVPMGAALWSPPRKPYKLFVGAKILNNRLSGDASAYGFLATGVDNFEVMGNVSVGKNSGLADGTYDIVCDEPGAFIYDPKTVTNSKLQGEFKKMERSLVHMLRCNHGPKVFSGFYSGYRAYSYGVHEKFAVTRCAFLEILARYPTGDELKWYAKLINDRSMPADELRIMLSQTKEFIESFGVLKREDLHLFRTNRWLDILDETIGELSEWDSMQIYNEAISKLNQKF